MIFSVIRLISTMIIGKLLGYNAGQASWSAAFVSVFGINAGPGFVSGLRTSGINFFLTRVFVTLIPTIAGILLRKYVFKLKEPITLGETADTLTTTDTLRTVCEKVKSNAPS